MPVVPRTSPSTAPDYPDRGAERVAFARRSKVIARDLLATTDVTFDFQLDDEFKKLLGRWIVIEVIGGEVGYFWESRDQFNDSPTLPVLAARAGETQCGRIPADRETVGYASKHFPVLKFVSGAAAVVIRIYDAEV